MIVGDTGIVVPPSCPDALFTGLEQMLQKLTPALQKSAREHIINRYANDVMIAATETVLQQLCKDTCG
jgi:hypothetical protein